ncbi:MAG: DUF4430 domain-containing protein [Candidatus Zixiibacteriota bacterium]|nr:MAG: DUF4430 domain-containing protein [candidate division Zixibacteria bacterium]
MKRHSSFLSVMLFGLTLGALITCGQGDQTEELVGTERPDSVVIEVAGMDSLTAFDVVARAYRVRYRWTTQGVFVRAIDSVENCDSHSWLYSVNDSFPSVAADKYMTSAGDRIKWHFRATK